MGTIDILGTDEKAVIFRYLNWPEILRDAFCGRWTIGDDDDATGALVASRNFALHNSRRNQRPIFDSRPPQYTVGSPEDYNALAWVACVLPRLRTLSLNRLPADYRYDNGGESVEEEAERKSAFDSSDDEEGAAKMHELGVDIVQSFRLVEQLNIRGARLNGTYPNFFNFSHLKQLHIGYMQYMKFDLEMVARMPLLEEVSLLHCKRLSGDIGSLGVLKDTLRSIQIAGDSNCEKIGGRLMDLSDFPRLHALRLRDTSIVGDVRDLRAHHFPALRQVDLPESVFGGRTFERIADVPEVMAALSCLQRRSPELFRTYSWTLSPNSPDHYRMSNIPEYRAPFNVQFVMEGMRLGWRWSSGGYYAGPWVQHCETNWLDPEPPGVGCPPVGNTVAGASCPSASFEEQLSLSDMDPFNILGLAGLGSSARSRYSGFYEPPTQQQYRKLLEQDPSVPRQYLSNI
ncbi:hypothetical protein ACHAXT_010464 [Thalassiosira profunda]